MRVLIVYESMFGHTRQIAEGIRDGLGAEATTRVVDVAIAPTTLDGFDVVVVGGPTHGWGMSWPSTRRSTPMRAAKPESGLVLEPGAAAGPGAREWLQSVRSTRGKAAAFDTRLNSRVLFTGRASKGIARQLTRHGFVMIVPPESFLVNKQSHLLPGETERARRWGADLARTFDRTGQR